MTLVIEDRRPEEPLEPILDADGNVAVKYTRQQLAFVEHTPSGKQYVFVCRANIYMSWVDPRDVAHIRGLKGGCCGNRTQIVYYLANESDVRRWTNNGGA